MADENKNKAEKAKEKRIKKAENALKAEEAKKSEGIQADEAKKTEEVTSSKPNEQKPSGDNMKHLPAAIIVLLLGIVGYGLYDNQTKTEAVPFGNVSIDNAVNNVLAENSKKMNNLTVSIPNISDYIPFFTKDTDVETAFIEFDKGMDQMNKEAKRLSNFNTTKAFHLTSGIHTIELMNKTQENFITFFDRSVEGTDPKLRNYVNAVNAKEKARVNKNFKTIQNKLVKVDNTLVANTGTLVQLKAAIDSPRIAKYAFANFNKLPKEFVFNGKLGSLTSVKGMPEGVGVICELSPTLYAQPISKTHNALWCALNIADNQQPMYVLYQADVPKVGILAETVVHVYRNGALFDKLNSFLRYQNMSDRKRMDMINTLGDPSHYVRQARLSAAYDNVSIRVNGKDYPVQKTSGTLEAGAIKSVSGVSSTSNHSNSGVAENDNYSVRINAKPGSGPISLDFGED